MRAARDKATAALRQRRVAADLCRIVYMANGRLLARAVVASDSDSVRYWPWSGTQWHFCSAALSRPAGWRERLRLSLVGPLRSALDQIVWAFPGPKAGR